VAKRKVTASARNRTQVVQPRSLIIRPVYTGTINCILLYYSLALQSSFGPSPPLILWFPNLFRHMVGLLGRVISPSQGLYLLRTAKHKKTRTNIHALSGIRTHDRSRPAPQTVWPLDRQLYIKQPKLIMLFMPGTGRRLVYRYDLLHNVGDTIN
jgi:hypothetical protein